MRYSLIIFQSCRKNTVDMYVIQTQGYPSLIKTCVIPIYLFDKNVDNFLTYDFPYFM